MNDDMKKFVFDVIGSEEGMKSKMVAEFNSLADKHGLSEKDIRRFVEIIFNHSFDTKGNSKFKESLSQFIEKISQ
jgi:hypothetical protein